MSRSNPTAKNPAVRFFQWSGGAELVEKNGDKEVYAGGKITWYDKEAQERKEQPMPLTFLVLDELTTIGGFSDADKSSYWSNEVRDLKNDILVVRTSAGIKARGTYAQLEDVKSKGAKFAQSVYIAFKDDSGELVIGNFKIMGAALTAWIEFKKKYDVYKCAVALERADGPHKKGTTRYFVPVFEGRNVTPETDAAAGELDKELQSYLKTYMTRRDDEEYATSAEDLEDGQEDESDIHNIEGIDNKPAEQPAEEPQAAAEPAQAAPTNKADETIKLKDVPF